jgi:hypothetical protein
MPKVAEISGFRPMLGAVIPAASCPLPDKLSVRGRSARAAGTDFDCPFSASH